MPVNARKIERDDEPGPPVRSSIVRTLDNPLFASGPEHAEEVMALRPIIAAQIIAPLRSSPNAPAFRARVEHFRPRWRRLRQLVGLSLLRALDVRSLLDHVEEAYALPLTNPAAIRAARQSRDLIVWLSHQSVDPQQPVIPSALERAEDAIAIIELCQLALISRPPPAPPIAECAAWRAYAAAKTLRDQLHALRLVDLPGGAR